MRESCTSGSVRGARSNPRPYRDRARSLPSGPPKAGPEQLYETTVAGSFYDRMSPAQRAELDAGIAEAERGQVLSAEEVFDRLAKRFGCSAV
jgi:hypothetical protein